MKKPRYKLRLFLLSLGSFIVSLAPICVVVAVRSGEYFKTLTDVLKFSAGAIIAIVLIVIKLLGKFKMPRRITAFAFVFVMSYLLAAVLKDLLLLSGAALLGELLDLILFQNAIRSTRERMTADRVGDAVADRIEESLKSYIGRV